MQPWRIAALIGAILIVGTAAAAPRSTAAPRSDLLPPDKQALEDFARLHQAKGNAANKQADPGRPASIPDPPPVTGLLGPVGAPIAGEEFTPTTAWAGWIDPVTYEQVWAGWAGDRASGAVLVGQWTGADGRITPGSAPRLRIVRAPAGKGPLTIARVDAADLLMTFADGQEVRFSPAAIAFR